jgi:hypothetical protein
MLKLCVTGAAATIVLRGFHTAAAPRLSADVTEKCRAASKLLADYLTELAAGAKRRVGNGPTLLMPCVTSAYSGVWPDDSLYPLIALPSLANKDELAGVLSFLSDSILDLPHVPDRVEPDGLPILSPGHSNMPPMTDRMPLHLPAAWVRLLDYYQGFGVQIPRKDDWARLIARSIERVPFANGLAYADPQHPPIGFGFQDSLRISGWELMSSLALYRGLQRAAVLFDGAIESSILHRWAAMAKNIRANLYRLYDPKIAGYCGGSRQGHQFSVWGNGLIFPLAEDSEKRSIVGFYRDNRAKIFLRGCTRQIAESGGWEGNVNGGQYQNGGFWATGTGYVLPVLAQQDPALCVELLGDLTANLSKIDFAEWLDAAGKPNGAMKFLGSVALPLIGLNSILQNKPLIEYF